jgi:hypothetical protein
MSEHGDDPLDNTTPIFTQAEVFIIGGYLSVIWNGPEDATDDIEAAIRVVLNL